MRAVIYARYSSDNQSEASIEDQIELCRRYVDRQGWTLSRTYEDRALSGAGDQRPAYQQMLGDAETRQFDVIVSEALDRLGRRLSDVARLYDRLEFQGILLHAVNIGQVTTMHVGLLGTMAQLYLSDLREHGAVNWDALLPARSPGKSVRIPACRWRARRASGGPSRSNRDPPHLSRICRRQIT